MALLLSSAGGGYLRSPSGTRAPPNDDYETNPAEPTAGAPRLADLGEGIAMYWAR